MTKEKNIGTGLSTDDNSKKGSHLGRKVGSSVKGVLGGSFLTRERMIRSIPFILFLVILALIYIANVYYVEKTVRETDDLKRDLEELRYEHITSKSNLEHLSKQSEVFKRIGTEGIKPSTVPPEKILIKSKKESDK